jgi:hypothetical protein
VRRWSGLLAWDERGGIDHITRARYSRAATGYSEDRLPDPRGRPIRLIGADGERAGAHAVRSVFAHYSSPKTPPGPWTLGVWRYARHGRSPLSDSVGETLVPQTDNSVKLSHDFKCD